MFSSADKLLEMVQKRVMLVAAFLVFSGAFVKNWEWVWGIGLGTCTGLAHFRNIYHSVSKNIGVAAVAKARWRAFGAYFLRYVITVAVLGLSYFRPQFSFIAVVLGLMLVKLVIITEASREKLVVLLDDYAKKIQILLERRE